MKKRLIYTIALAGTLLATSCQDFLDRKPFDSIPQSEAIRNLKDAEASINGVYAVWSSDGLYSGNLTLAPDLQCDFAYSIVGFTNKMGNLYNWNIIPTNEYTESTYAHLYKVISNVNLLLDSRPNIKIKESETERFNHILGEAYCSRALAYTELVKNFAQAYNPTSAAQQTGVSIWNVFGAGKPGRETLEKNYEQIFEDLKMADSLLVDLEPNVFRINKSAVDALYARVYLYTQQWDKAIKAATNVINNTNYELVSGFTEEDTLASQTKFKRMWEYDDSKEIIWQLKYTKTYMPGNLGVGFCGTNGNKLRIDFAPALSVVNTYEPNDIRGQVYFSKESINGGKMPILIKYPGNPDLRPSVAPVYANMPKIFRLAEMYLIRAEAHAKNNQETEANTDLQILRSKRIKNYTHNRISGNTLINEIRKERVKELFMEGHRMYDLKRYGEGFTRQKQNQSIAPGDQLNIVPTNHCFVWPIPSHELDANRNMIQNPGY